MHYVSAGAYRCHKRASVPLELELQAVVRYLMWMLQKQYTFLSPEQSLQTPRKINFNLSSPGWLKHFIQRFGTSLLGTEVL